jgi:hypothetical protein
VRQASPNSILLSGEIRMDRRRAGSASVVTDTLVLARLSPDGAQISKVLSDRRVSTEGITDAGSRIAYYAENYWYRGRVTWNVYTIPLEEMGRGDINPAEAFTLWAALDEQTVSVPVLRLRPDMLMYTTEGELHARTYDGKLEIVLDTTITNLYDLTQQYGETVYLK